MNCLNDVLNSHEWHDGDYDEYDTPYLVNCAQHLGHDPEEMKRDGRIFCRAFAAFVYAKDKCASCENNRTAHEKGRQTNG